MIDNRSLGQNQGNQTASGKARARAGTEMAGPNIGQAVMGGMPTGNAVFNGAQQTIGAQNSRPGQPAYTPSNDANFPNAPAQYLPKNGNTGINGGGALDRLSTQSQPAAQRFNGKSPEDFLREQLGTISYGPEELRKLTETLKQHGLIVNTATDGGVRGRITDEESGDFWDVLDPNESQHWWTNLQGKQWRDNLVRQKPTLPGSGLIGAPRMNNVPLMNAITQRLPGFQEGDTNDTYSARLREQVMKAISNPDLVGLLGMY
jgi:hypothetical protein